MIPETLWQVFSNQFLPVKEAPSDAVDWLEKGYIRLAEQGKIQGYAVTQLAYELIVDKDRP